MDLRRGGPLAVELTGVRHNGGGLTQEDRIGSEPKDEIRQRPMGDRVEDLGGRKMAASPDEEMRL